MQCNSTCAGIACSLVTALVIATLAISGQDDMHDKILATVPAADSNRDGVLSIREEARLFEVILKRFPRLDVDGDGALSSREKQGVMRRFSHSSNADGLGELLAEQSLTDDLVAAVPEDIRQSQSVIRQEPKVMSPGDQGIGRRIADLEFVDINGKQFSLGDFSDHPALVIALTGTGCPLCLKYGSTLAAIEQRYAERGIAFVFLNPHQSESIVEWRRKIQKLGFQGPCVHDTRMEMISELQARTTTEVFVLDAARTLVYRGAVDDQYGLGYALGRPRQNFLTAALDAVLVNQPVATEATTAPGCELLNNYADKPATEPVLTYHNRISRILQAHCIECHRQDGVAPFSLDTFVGVKDYAAMIRNVVERQVMPPWFAAPHAFQPGEVTSPVRWANDPSLSEREKSDLLSWIDAGAIEGDPADAPIPRVFPDGWLIGEPDAIFEFPRPVPVRANGVMPYQNVTVETDLVEDKWIQAMEIRPGQPSVVHHVIVSLLVEGRPFNERDGYWGVYVPGNSTLSYPDGLARRLPRGAKLQFQMHYTPNGEATEDRTRIGLIFSREPPRHEVHVSGIYNSRFSIPPGAPGHRVQANLPVPFDVQLLSFLPHMHLRGKAARYELETDDRILTLLDIPNYDFNWQLRYRLAEPLPLKSGDRLKFTGWFDNSAANIANPDPTRTVRWGPQTTDEMMLGYVEYFVPGLAPGDSIGSLRSSRPREHDLRNGGGDSRNRGSGLTLQAVMTAIERFDANGNGVLEESEVPRERRRIFVRLDGDGNGRLTRDEARSSMERLLKIRDRN